MKLDKRDPSHWLHLLLFALNVALAIALRPLWPRRARRQVVLYGHRLNGNLQAIAERARREHGDLLELTYLSMDRAYCRELAAQGQSSCPASSARCIALLARADAVISDHGLHALEGLLRATRVPFLDVWHGIPFKGFDAADFTVQHRYAEAWVASPLLATMYVERFGFAPGRVRATGYARTDILARPPPADAIEALRSRLGLDATRGRKVVLFAPTWKQDAAGRSVFPFGLDAAAFFAGLEQVCARTGAVALFRTHLNSGDLPAGAAGHVICVPHARFPDTEAILLLADVLVCDWSSIAFDYLLLDRPTIFLDVPAPFAKGFSLGPEYRFGAIVAGQDAFLARLGQSLSAPDEYRREFGATHAAIRARVYGDCADGESARRCVERLLAVLADR